MGQFKSAIYNSNKKILRISYLYIGGTATRQNYELVIQVPTGYENEAERVVVELRQQYSRKKAKA